MDTVLLTGSPAAPDLIGDEKSKKTARLRTERKKLQDRLSQRATRERTKQRIAALEEALSCFESGDDKTFLASLMRTNANLRNRNQRLRSTIDKIYDMINLVKLLPEDEYCDNNREVKPGDGSSRSNPSASDFYVAVADQNEILDGIFHPKDLNNSAFDEPIATASSHARVHMIIPGHRQDYNRENNTFQHKAHMGYISTEDFSSSEVPEVIDTTIPKIDNTRDDRGRQAHDLDVQNKVEIFDTTHLSYWNTYSSSLFEFPPAPSELNPRIASDAEKWYVGNSAYFEALDSIRRLIRSATTMDFQVALKAAFWGWHSVDNEADHPVWKALRQVDQQIFGTWKSKAQRIAMMYVCQTLIQYREDPTPDNLSRVPWFLRPRPAQERLEHPVVIDFLIWPGMRDRMMFEHEKYCASGTFSGAYVENFSFFWPYSDQDIINYSHDRDRYEFSPVFLEYVYEYKNWTMKAGFYEKCPEMQYDVPVFQNINSVTELGILV